MANIDDTPAAVTAAGETFDYLNPPRLVTIVLVNAPLDPDHLNIGLNQAAYDAFIAGEIAAGRAYVETDLNIQNPEHDLRLPIEYETALTFYNYGRLTIGTRNWYIFYTPEYLNKEVTRFVADIDEFASFSWTLGYSTIERGHIAVAASQGDTYGSNYLTAPEPIEAPPVRGILSAPILSSVPNQLTVLVVSTNDLRGTGGSTPFFEQHVRTGDIGAAAADATNATANSSGAVQIDIPGAAYPWSTGDPKTGTGFLAYTPYVTASPVSTIDGVSAGGGVYLFTANGFAEYMTTMQGAPWVIAGIVDIRLVPAWAVGGGGDATFAPYVPPQGPVSSAWNAAASIPVFSAQVSSLTTSVTALTDWRASALSAISGDGWTKLLTSQFTEILLGNGETAEKYAPDQWQASDLTFTAVTGAANGDPEIRLIPSGYNDLGSQRGVSTPVGGRAGIARSGYGIAASNTAQSVYTPYVSAYNAATTRDIVTKQQALAVALTLHGVQLGIGNQAISTALGVVGGIATAAATDGASLAGSASSAGAGVGSLASSTLSGLTSMVMLDSSNAGSFDIATFQQGINLALSVDIFDVWAQALDSVSGAGSAHRLASSWRSIVAQAFDAIIVVPSQERVNAAVAMFSRYGYMIGQAFAPPRLDAMSHYTYWKTADTIITGAVPQSRRQTIAGSFERGLTVWASIAEIGTKPVNTPIAGISY